MEFTKYIDVAIVAFCLAIGFVIKKWLKDVDNKYIPTVVFILGAVAGVQGYGLNLNGLTVGMISGLASTGLHQVFKQFIDGRGGENGEL